MNQHPREAAQPSNFEPPVVFISLQKEVVIPYFCVIRHCLLKWIFFVQTLSLALLVGMEHFHCSACTVSGFALLQRCCWAKRTARQHLIASQTPPGVPRQALLVLVLVESLELASFVL